MVRSTAERLGRCLFCTVARDGGPVAGTPYGRQFPPHFGQLLQAIMPFHRVERDALRMRIAIVGKGVWGHRKLLQSWDRHRVQPSRAREVPLVVPRAFFRWALDDVEPAFAVLGLGHERLRPFQPFRDLMLGQPCLLASRDQQLAEGALPERVGGFANAACTKRNSF